MGIIQCGCLKFEFKQEDTGTKMILFKVTLFAKKAWMDTPYEMSWVTVADTPEGAIEKVTDSLDLSGVEIVKFKVEKSEDPVLINIKEK